MEALNLINAEQDLVFGGETYKVKKANLGKVILFQARFNELSETKDPAIESKVAAYCLYLILKDVKIDITEEWVMENAPGDIDFTEIIENFGFMNRQKVETLRKILKRNAPIQTTDGTGE